jgi:hypothetical protein
MTLHTFHAFGIAATIMGALQGQVHAMPRLGFGAFEGVLHDMGLT